MLGTKFLASLRGTIVLPRRGQRAHSLNSGTRLLGDPKTATLGYQTEPIRLLQDRLQWLRQVGMAMECRVVELA
jgi:hypothetical protein